MAVKALFGEPLFFSYLIMTSVGAILAAVHNGSPLG